MSLYPSLEGARAFVISRATVFTQPFSDLNVDQMAKGQVNQQRLTQAIAYSQQTGAPVTVSLYGDLGLEEMLQR